MFEKGHKLAKGGKREGAGRKKSPATIRKEVKRDFETEYPNAYFELLLKEYGKGIQGNSQSAQYVMDRLRGRPSQMVTMPEDDRKLLQASTVIEFWKLLKSQEPPLLEGEYTLIEDHSNTQD